ncbi:SSI family serine proteinase inhibitor [Kitasatospora sp. NBC_00315]|uniref:SSI family serine proteinase inhibitor n=1 Tax=Kitasatospora sp. NBC_00315 TaxID=2975963 RepID=UPI0032469350
MSSTQLRRAAAVTAAAAALLIALGQAVAAQPPPARDDSGDRLTVTLSSGAGPAVDGRHELRCHPTGGDHPEPRAACDRLDSLTSWGRDLFAPVPPDAVCAQRYGGPATARVTGHWAGRPVDARFSRRDGCEIARWDSFVPLLPPVAAAQAPSAGPSQTAVTPLT